MKDLKTLERIQLIHPIIRDELFELYDDICSELTGRAICRFTYTLRTFAEQNALFAIGRTKPGKRVTNARGGMSFHNFGLAVDVCLLVDHNNDGKFESASWDRIMDFDGDKRPDFMEIVNVFKQYGWEWGGDWRFVDPPHFQKTLGKSVRELLKLHSAGKVDQNGFVRL
jgi:peptidoglycan L-alanyl-D-glutamate endopeptidase CwlK